MNMPMYRGFMPLMILALLKREDMYGYQLVQEISAASSELVATQEGTVYPVLYKLEGAELISGRKVQTGKRMTRIYYHIEPAGEEYLAKLAAEFQSVTTGILKILGDPAL